MWAVQCSYGRMLSGSSSFWKAMWSGTIGGILAVARRSSIPGIIYRFWIASPGLRNGAPFRHWDLPEAIAHVGEQLQRRYPDWDRQYVGILQAIPLYGPEAVEAACGKALTMGTFSKEVVLNLLNRGREDTAAAPIEPPEHLILKQPPVADCQRYDRLLQEVAYAAQ